MPRLIDMDAFGIDRREHDLHAGAALSDELLRLFPRGLVGAWQLYDRQIDPARAIAAIDAERWRVEGHSVVVLVRKPGTPDIWINLAVSVILTLAARLLAPKPRRPHRAQVEEQDSGTNQIAAQSNLMRAGARVPDILGTMRVYPDLLVWPIEIWGEPTSTGQGSGRTQSIEQYFVIGRGAYATTDYRLGDQSFAQVSGLAIHNYAPGDPITPPILCVRTSATVNSIALNAQDGSTLPTVSDVEFEASSSTMTTHEALALGIGQPIAIDGTLSNDGVRFVTAIATAGTDSVYTLEGPVADETGANPLITPFFFSLTQGYSDCQVDSDDITFTVSYYINAYAVNDAIRIEYAGHIYFGTIRALTVLASDPYSQTLRIDVDDLSGTPMSFSYSASAYVLISNWHPPTPAGGGGSSDDTPPTDWQAAPLANPDELWLDFAFPQGLVKFVDSVRRPHTVEIRADIRRGIGPTLLSFTFSYTEAINAPLRWTERIPVSSLVALPGTDPFQVRVQRITELLPDTASTQYVSETRWEAFRAMHIDTTPSYPDVTIMRLRLTNSRSASSIGENSFNCIATRILPHWNGASWDAPAPTDLWADNFVERCRASDGANLPDALIDLAGIYALQAQLDALDGGAQGLISLAIDQVQDIDTELVQIADVVRAGVYRVGRKLFVTRDQDGATPLALFNGRAKSADGEAVAVRMKSDDENDAVVVSWIDRLSGWKLRELSYADPPNPTPTNPLRIGAQCANWPQVWRRAAFEWNKLKYRRERITVAVTEDGRICRPGDVVHITDDIGNLAIGAGEVIAIVGSVLVVDRDLDFSGGGTFTILLRDVEGINVDAVPCVAVAGVPNRVQLSRAPLVTIKARDASMGTLYSFYADAAVTVRKWLLSAVESTSPPWVQLTGSNYSPTVFQGDTATLPDWPPIE